jgi:hypothetical protein
MGIISLLIKIFFFYIVYSILIGVWNVYKSYRVLQKQSADSGGRGTSKEYAQRTSYSEQQSGETIEAEFQVLGEKDI